MVVVNEDEKDRVVHLNFEEFHLDHGSNVIRGKGLD